jgi:hypothetical protein
MVNCTGTGPETLHLTRAIAIGDEAARLPNPRSSVALMSRPYHLVPSLPQDLHPEKVEATIHGASRVVDSG